MASRINAAGIPNITTELGSPAFQITTGFTTAYDDNASSLYITDPDFRVKEFGVQGGQTAKRWEFHAKLEHDGSNWLLKLLDSQGGEVTQETLDDVAAFAQILSGLTFTDNGGDAANVVYVQGRYPDAHLFNFNTSLMKNQDGVLVLNGSTTLQNANLNTDSSVESYSRVIVRNFNQTAVTRNVLRQRLPH